MPISKDNMRLIDDGFRKYAREVFEKEWDKRRGEWDAVFNEDKTKVMDIVERLRGYDENDLVYKTDMIEAANEIERLRQQNAELVEELWGIALHSGSREASEMARAAIAKATGGE